jgi:hypothetical protein
MHASSNHLSRVRAVRRCCHPSLLREPLEPKIIRRNGKWLVSKANQHGKQSVTRFVFASRDMTDQNLRETHGTERSIRTNWTRFDLILATRHSSTPSSVHDIRIAIRSTNKPYIAHNRANDPTKLESSWALFALSVGNKKIILSACDPTKTPRTGFSNFPNSLPPTKTA